MLWIIIGILISYLIGSIPTAYIFGRVIKGIDIRKFGSGNIGATNALRVLGRGWGITVLILDMLKGFLPVIIFGNFLIKNSLSFKQETIFILLGLACISGHNWTIFLGFKGGKGVATTLGVLMGLAYLIPSLRMISLLVIGTWFLIFFIWRYISVASLAAGFSLPLYMLVFGQPLILILSSLVISIFIFLRHIPNIRRLAQGLEPKLKFKKE